MAPPTSTSPARDDSVYHFMLEAEHFANCIRTGTQLRRRRAKRACTTCSPSSPSTKPPARPSPEKLAHLTAGQLVLASSRRLQPQLRHHHLQVLPRLGLLSRIAQQERRMIRHRQLRPAAGMPPPAQRTQRLLHPQQIRRRRRRPARRSPPAAPRRSGAAGTASRYSPPPAPARGCPAAGTSRCSRCRPPRAPAPSRAIMLFSNWPALPTNGSALRVLVRARAFADEHQPRRRASRRQRRSCAAPHRPADSACSRQSLPESHAAPRRAPQPGPARAGSGARLLKETSFMSCGTEASARRSWRKCRGTVSGKSSMRGASPRHGGRPAVTADWAQPGSCNQLPPTAAAPTRHGDRSHGRRGRGSSPPTRATAVSASPCIELALQLRLERELRSFGSSRRRRTSRGPG